MESETTTEVDAKTELQELMLHLMYGSSFIHPRDRQDIMAREIVVTPFDGAYGRAGFVIAVNGSPPRGVITSMESDPRDTNIRPPIFYLSTDRTRRLGEAQARVVRRFLVEHIAAAGDDGI